MTDALYLILFILVFFPFVLMNFQKIHKAQQEIIELLKETNRLMAGKSDQPKA